MKVEALNNAYVAWDKDCDADGADANGDGGGGLRIRSSGEIAKWFDLPSYKRLESMFDELTQSERVELLALAWFTRDRVADWPRNFERAKEMASILEKRYQIGLAGDWLAGLNRWKEKPRAFEAGRWRRI